MATATYLESTETISPKVKITEMDHIVLRVNDMDASLRFYSEVLGLGVERLEDYRAGKVPFPSVRLNADTIIDLFAFPDQEPIGNGPKNQDHFCMVVEPTDLDEVRAELEALGIGIREGPAKRWGAHGDGTSLYIFDPDDNVVELRYYE